MRKLLLGFVLGVLFLPIAGVAAARCGLLPVGATAAPPAWERWLAATALRASLAKDAAHVANSVSADEASLTTGMKLYRDNCAGCHGEPGRPSVWGTSGFYPRVPQLSDHPSALTPSEIYLVVKHGIRYSGMGAWTGLMADEDIWRVALFLSRMNDLPPAVKAVWTRNAVPGGA